MTDVRPRPDLLSEVSAMLYEAADEHGSASPSALIRYVHNQYGPHAAGHAAHILDRLVRRRAFVADDVGRVRLVRRPALGGRR